MKDRIVKLLFSISLVCSTLLNGQIDIILIESQNDWKFITKQSEDQDLPIVVFICDPTESICAEFDDLVNNDPILQDYLSPRFIQTRINSNSYFGDRFIYEYGVEFIPSALIFNTEGVAMNRLMGLQETQYWLQFFQEGRKRAASYTQLMEGWEKKKLTKDGFCACADIFDLNLRVEDAFAAGFECVSKLSPTLYLNPEYRSSILKYGIDLELPIVPYFIDNLEYVARQDSTFPIDDFLEDAYFHNTEMAILLKDEIRIQYVVEELLLAINDEEVPDSSSTLELYFESVDDWPKWMSHLERTYANDSTTELRLRKSIDKVRNDHKRDTVFLSWLKDYTQGTNLLSDYNTNYLLAWACFYSGDLKRAEEVASVASELSSSAEERSEMRQLSLRIRFALRQK